MSVETVNTEKVNVSLVGKKLGMTRLSTEDGASVAVTVVEVLPNKVTQIKTLESDGYYGVQVTTGQRKRSRLNKPKVGHFAKANVEPGDGLWEFRVKDAQGLNGIQIGSDLNLDRFMVGQYVDVIGVTKGKGFAGAIKRHHFSSQDDSHGNSRSHRAPGSIGQRQSPGKVFKGKKMAGHLGDVRRTILSQRIINIDLERNLVFVQGAIPGAPNHYVIIRSAVKKSA